MPDQPPPERARKVHLKLYGNAVACGAETSWRRRFAAIETLDLPRTTDRSSVTCQNCLNAMIASGK